MSYLAFNRCDVVWLEINTSSVFLVSLGGVLVGYVFGPIFIACAIHFNATQIERQYQRSLSLKPRARESQQMA